MNDRTPRAADFPKLDTAKTTSQRSPSKFVLKEVDERYTTFAPKELKPLIIPVGAGSQVRDEVSSAHSIDGMIAIPPEVPPKSPRTESRASPRIKKPPHSANSSISTVNSVASSVSNRSLKDEWSPRRLQTKNRNESLSSLKGLENVLPRQSPSTPSGAASRNPSRSPMRCESSEGTVISSRSSDHDRERTRTSFDEERPVASRRRDTTSIHGLIRTIYQQPSQSQDNVNLPIGFRAIDATTVVPEEEAKALKKQANRHVERFEVLQVKDVSMLSQELELLDERCEYLQTTHKSLRQGRLNLQIRMIS